MTKNASIGPHLVANKRWMGTSTSSKYFYLSILFDGASLIPLIKYNDVNWALMSSNVQHQAIPLPRFEECIVETGLEHQVTLDSGALTISEHKRKDHFYQCSQVISKPPTKRSELINDLTQHDATSLYQDSCQALLSQNIRSLKHNVVVLYKLI